MIFFAGFLTGGALVWKLARQTEPQASDNSEAVSFQPWQLKEKYVGYLAKKLQLSDEQKNSISQIVTESQHRTKILLELISPEMREEMREVRDSIRAVLTPEQQSEFDEIQRRHDRHHKVNDKQPDSSGQEGGESPSGPDAANGGDPLFKRKCHNEWPVDNLDWLPIIDLHSSG